MKFKKIISILLVCLFILSNSVLVFGEEENTTTNVDVVIESPSAILIEANTGQVLFEKNADEKLRPASVTKVMTLLLAFEAIDSGNMSLDDIITFSEHAASMGGSQCFFEAGETQRVEDVIKCIIISSGNDAAVAMAEHLGGSEEGFVNMMNARAQELGMVNTNFVNACGLESDGHLTTSRDIAIMSRELTVNHPTIFNYSQIWMDTIIHSTKRGDSEFGLSNTNKLLKQYNGATGLKTGYTSVAGYSMAATATRNDISLIAVIMGASTKEIRNADASKLLDYGFSKCAVYEDNQVMSDVNSIKVERGKKDYVAFNKDESFKYVCVKEQSESVCKKVTLNDKIVAPVKKGDVLGRVEYYIGDNLVGTVNIVATEDVKAVKYNDCFVNILLNFLCE